MHGFIVAGTNSGCGKTTATIGLMALFKTMGKKLAPFKTGPDYIDPLFHAKVLQTPSYNLDSFMLPEKTIKHLFHKHSTHSDIAIVEGVMGMYDGMGEQAIGSSHDLSLILDLPVILLVSCKGLYQSIAAIVKGFCTLRSDAKVKGVILNHVPNDEFYAFLKSIVERECGVACLGYIPSNKDFKFESRHLGLIQAEEVSDFDVKIEKLAQTLAKTIDVEALLNISKLDCPSKEESFILPDLDLSDLHIGVAYDKAFRFYYKDNLELLEKLGASLHYFSPLTDKSLPQQCNCLYIGGGYPEVFSKEITANKEFMHVIKEAVKSGMPVYAECGGLMYLTKKIIDLDSTEHNMCGVFNCSIQMTKRLQRFGYATLNYQGSETKCHEFHRSKIIDSADDANYKLEFQLKKPEKLLDWQCGLKHKNCLAGYAHVHFYSNFEFFHQIIKLWKKAII